MGQFVVAAVSDRRNLLKQKTAVRDRRYKRIKLTHYLPWRWLDFTSPFG
jgi:hypothetical protein